MVLVDPDKPLVVQVPSYKAPQKEVRHKKLLSGITVLVEDHTAQTLSDALARQEGRWLQHTTAQSEMKKVEVARPTKPTATLTSSGAGPIASKPTVTASAGGPIDTTTTVTSSTVGPVAATVISSAAEPIAATVTSSAAQSIATTVTSSAAGPIAAISSVMSLGTGQIAATTTVTSSAAGPKTATTTVTSTVGPIAATSSADRAIEVESVAAKSSTTVSGMEAPSTMQAFIASTSASKTNAGIFVTTSSVAISTTEATILATSGTATTSVAMLSASTTTMDVLAEAATTPLLSNTVVPQTKPVTPAKVTSVATVSMTSTNTVTSPSVTSSASMTSSSVPVTSHLMLRSTSPVSDIGIFEIVPDVPDVSATVPSVSQDNSRNSVQGHNSATATKTVANSNAKRNVSRDMPKTSAKDEDRSKDSNTLPNIVGRTRQTWGSQTQAIEGALPESREMSAGDKVKETLEKLKKMKCSVPKIVGLPFQDLVILDTMSHIHNEKDAASILQQTAKYNDIDINFLYESIPENQWKCRVEVKEVALAEVKADNKLDAHKAAAEKCLERLQNMCWTVHEKHPSAMDPGTGIY